MHSLLRSLALAFLLPTIAAAQQIRGVVVEDSTFRPISGATIDVIASDGTIRGTSSAAANGWFSFAHQGGGPLLLRATHPAYTIQGTLNVVVGREESITVILRMSGGPIPIDPLIVNAAARSRLGGYQERARRGAFGRFITRADIDKRGGYSMSHILRFTPEVRIERVRDGPFTSDGVFMRSFGDLCVPSVFLDGMPVATGSVFDINDLLSLEAVEGIEVYRSALSAPMEFRLPGFGSDGTCGVIAIWSRSLPRAPLTFTRVLYTGLVVGGSMLFFRLIQ